MINRGITWPLAAVTFVLTIALCGFKPGAAEQKASPPVAQGQPVKVVLPIKPVGRNLVFGIYWTGGSYTDPKAGLSRAKGIVTVVGDGSSLRRLFIIT